MRRLRPRELHHLVIETGDSTEGNLLRTHTMGTLAQLAEFTQNYMGQTNLRLGMSGHSARFGFTLTRFRGGRLRPKYEVVPKPLSDNEIINVRENAASYPYLPTFLALVGLASRESFGLDPLRN